MAEVTVAASSANRVSDINARVGRLVMNVLSRTDLSSPRKNRYLRMIQRAGRNMLGLGNQ